MREELLVSANNFKKIMILLIATALVTIGIKIFIHDAVLQTIPYFICAVICFINYYSPHKKILMNSLFVAINLTILTESFLNGGLFSPAMVWLITAFPLTLAFIIGPKNYSLYWSGAIFLELTMVFVSHYFNLVEDGQGIGLDSIAFASISSRYLSYAMLMGIISYITNTNELIKNNIFQKSIDIEKKIAAQQKMALIGELSSGISHEINNPLSVISLNNELALMTLESGDLEKIRALIEKNQKSVTQINDILRGVKNLMYNQQAEFSKVSVDEILEDVENIIKYKVNRHGIKLSIDKNGLGNLIIKSNKTYISQCLVNLISNSVDAIKACDEKYIVVSILKTEDSIDFIVRDSGEGISKTVAKNMFTPLFTTKVQGEGTGFGLSLSKKNSSRAP